MLRGMKNETWLTWDQWVWNNVLENFELYGTAKRLPVNVPVQKHLNDNSAPESLQMSLLQPND